MTHEREAPTWRDVEAVARLVGDLSDPGLAPGQREQHFLEEASRQLGGKLGFLFRGEYTGLRSDPLRFVSMHDVGLGASERELMQSYLLENGQDDPLIAPTNAQILRRPVLETQTFLRRDLITARAFHRHPHYRLCEALGGDDRLVVAVRTSQRRVVCLSLMRGPEERAFGERDRRLSRILLTQAARVLVGPPVPLGGVLRRGDGTTLDLKQGGSPRTLFGLTPREVQVAEWVARGLTNKEIARELRISPQTVKRHLSNALAKSGTETRTELACLVLTLRGQDGRDP